MCPHTIYHFSFEPWRSPDHDAHQKPRFDTSWICSPLGHIKAGVTSREVQFGGFIGAKIIHHSSLFNDFVCSLLNYSLLVIEHMLSGFVTQVLLLIMLVICWYLYIQHCTQMLILFVVAGTRSSNLVFNCLFRPFFGDIPKSVYVFAGYIRYYWYLCRLIPSCCLS